MVVVMVENFGFFRLNENTKFCVFRRVYTAYCRGVGGVGRFFFECRNLQILSVQLNRFIYKEAIIWQSRSEIG